MSQINFTTQVVSADFEEDTVTFILPIGTKLEGGGYQIIKL